MEEPRNHTRGRSYVDVIFAAAFVAVFGAASTGAAEGEPAASLAPFLRLKSVDPFLAGEDEAAARTLSHHCPGATRSCLRFLREQPAAAARTIPDNPEYWQAYAAVLATPSMPSIDASLAWNSHQDQEVIAATNAWVRRALLDAGGIDGRALHGQVFAHRRLLADSASLMDKMVFTASVGIMLSAVNAYMAQHELVPLRREVTVLDRMLQPLSPEELSVREVWHNEFAHMSAQAGSGPLPPGSPTLESVAVLVDYLADRSAAGWADYWQRGFDLEAVSVPPETAQWVPQYHVYSTSIRYLDGSLEVLRALREVYEGRVSPGPPARPAPYGWHWQWQGEEQSLCLAPGYVHASLGEPSTLCFEYLNAAIVDSPP